MYGAFAVFLLGLPALTFATAWHGRWWLLVLVPFGLLLAYAALRLLSLKVVLDERGVNEIQPLFRPTIVTAWDDIVRVRRTESDGAVGLRFLGVSIEHRSDGGFKHQVLALNIPARDPLADATVAGWVKQIRDAQKRFQSAD